MNINQIRRLQKCVKKHVLLIGILLLPFVSNSQNSPILSEIVLDSFCYGTDGVVTIVPVDPNNTYHYVFGNDTILATETPVGSGNWVNAPFDSVFTFVNPGTYYIALFEAPNPSVFFVDTIVIPDPQDSITAVTTVSQNLICHGDSTGVAEVLAIGGVLPYTYLWPSTGSTTNTVINLWVGFHDVIITDAMDVKLGLLLRLKIFIHHLM